MGYCASSRRLGASACPWHKTNCTRRCSIRSSQACELSDRVCIGPICRWASTPDNQRGKNVSESTWVAAKRKLACAMWWAARALVRAASNWASTASISGSKRCPAAVSTAGCALRSNKSTPTHSSSARIWRLKAGWAMARASAAREKLPLSHKAKKSSNHSRSRGRLPGPMGSAFCGVYTRWWGLGAQIDVCDWSIGRQAALRK